jgi:hypothetical protein
MIPVIVKLCESPQRRAGGLVMINNGVLIDYLAVYRNIRTLNGERYVEFLKQLLVYYKDKIILIEMTPPYHGSNVIKDLKSAKVTRLTIEGCLIFS